MIDYFMVIFPSIIAYVFFYVLFSPDLLCLRVFTGTANKPIQRTKLGINGRWRKIIDNN